MARKSDSSSILLYSILISAALLFFSGLPYAHAEWAWNKNRRDIEELQKRISDLSGQLQKIQKEVHDSRNSFGEKIDTLEKELKETVSMIESLRG
jgi:peptidoglycan hydrolase CwlO-like protein